MNIDLNTPIIENRMFPQRDETFIVSFEGFIKNISESLIRFMLRDREYWIKKYPGLSLFDNISPGDIYYNTMFFPPMILLQSIANDTLTEEEIENDMYFISSSVSLFNSLMTSFEYSLYRLLQEPFVKKVYIYKPFSFFENEIEYLSEKYIDVIDKIELESECPIHELYEKINATTIFTTDLGFIFDYIKNTAPEEKKKHQTFIVLNTVNNLVFFEENNKNSYDMEFWKRVQAINNTDDSYRVFPMYNFYIDGASIDQTDLYHSQDDEDETYDYIEQEEEDEILYQVPPSDLNLF